MAYKTFPKRELISDWAKLLKMSREEVCTLYDEWKLIDQENKEASKKSYEEKSNKIEEITKFLVSKGINPNKYKGILSRKNGYQAWYQKNVVEVISNKYPYYSSGIPTAHSTSKEVNGVEIFCNQSPTTIVELYDKIIWQYNSKIKEKNKSNKLLIKSIEYATLHIIDIEDLNTEQIIYRVSEYAKEEYLKESLPDGTDIYLKHGCDECSSYIMGERRCSCGNRRISIIVEGDIIDGFDYYPEPY